MGRMCIAYVLHEICTCCTCTVHLITFDLFHKETCFKFTVTSTVEQNSSVKISRFIASSPLFLYVPLSPHKQTLQGSIFHFNPTIKQHWSVTNTTQPLCIFNAFPAYTVSVVIKPHSNALRVDDVWQRWFVITSFYSNLCLYRRRERELNWSKASNKHQLSNTSCTMAEQGNGCRVSGRERVIKNAGPI